MVKKSVDNVKELIETSKEMLSNEMTKYQLFDDLIYYLRRFWNTIDSIAELRINICLNYYFHRYKQNTTSTSKWMAAAGILSYDQRIFRDCYYRSLFHTTKGADELINILMDGYEEQKMGAYDNGNDSDLCVDFKCLGIFQKLRQIPSVVKFAVGFIKAFGDRIGVNRIKFVKMMSDYKLNIQVFALFINKILSSNIFDAIDVWEVSEYIKKQPQKLSYI